MTIRRAGNILFRLMRLWTLHPKHLDARGLVALWREALLAQKVLRGATRGYKHHPQLRPLHRNEESACGVGNLLESGS